MDVYRHVLEIDTSESRKRGEAFFWTEVVLFFVICRTYSREVGVHGAIAPHCGKFYGILSGIDPDIWDPYTNNFIEVLIFQISNGYQSHKEFSS